MEGWIKIHRKLLDNPIVCKDSDYLSVWIYLLLSATHKEYDTLFKGKRITLQKGELITGILSIAKKLKLNKDKVQRILKSFESDKQIEQQTSNQNRLISILNWNEYQEFDKQNDKQVINECETTDKQVITNKNDKNIKNDKNNNIKKEKNKKPKTFDDVFAENNFSDELEGTIRDFIDMRKTIKKPMTSKALELLIKNLKKLTNLEEEQIAILNQSIEHGWQTVYALKEKFVPEEKAQEKYTIIDTQNISQEEYKKILDERGGNNGR